MKIDYCDILTIDRNNAFLANLALKSTIKNLKNVRYHIYVVDNSDADKHFQTADFLAKHLDKITVEVNDSVYSYDKTGSIGHARTIQQFIDRHKDISNLLLIESDVVLLKDVDFLDDSVIAAGQTTFGKNFMHEKIPYTIFKIQPWFLYLNVQMMRKLHITFFDSNLQKLPFPEYGIMHDTGSHFMEEIAKRNLQIKNVDIDRYMIHFQHMSSLDKSSREYQEKLRKAIRLTDYEV